ncbi:MAG: methylase [Porticoccus sp.]|jgi:cyclopropane fatty-acyl-phospholipid synthase-like methyltransferase|nr:methylase [Porticoccus sp.]|tara:strand:+ start:1317 stop:1916 length:600 start_codon:yes stop_codon:yes gene_type:complete
MALKKTFSQACDNNRQPILNRLIKIFSNTHNVLEIGSGTGQHAVFFSLHLPRLVWHTSDLPCNHDTINAWIKSSSASNVRSPLVFDANSTQWTNSLVDGLFTANTCHIMTWSTLANFFRRLHTILAPGGIFVIYGPFKYGGKFTSQSNQEFDLILKNNCSHQGIRDFEALDELAAGAGLKLIEDCPMPANNQLLAWKRE